MLKPTPVWHAARLVGPRRLYSADTMRSVSREQNEWAHFSKPTNGVLFAWVVGKRVCNVMQPLLQRVRHEVKREVDNTAPRGTILHQRRYWTWKLSWCCQSLFSQEIKASGPVSLFLICWLTCHFLFVATVYELFWQKPPTHCGFLCFRSRWCWKRNTEEDKSCLVFRLSGRKQREELSQSQDEGDESTSVLFSDPIFKLAQPGNALFLNVADTRHSCPFGDRSSSVSQWRARQPEASL